jgi:hypothetical protein
MTSEYRIWRPGNDVEWGKPANIMVQPEEAHFFCFSLSSIYDD